jgi:hypothetical protein
VNANLQATFIWIKNKKAKIAKSQPGIVACAEILQMGGWNLKTIGL